MDIQTLRSLFGQYVPESALTDQGVDWNAILNARIASVDPSLAGKAYLTDWGGQGTKYIPDYEYRGGTQDLIADAGSMYSYDAGPDPYNLEALGLDDMAYGAWIPVGDIAESDKKWVRGDAQTYPNWQFVSIFDDATIDPSKIDPRYRVLDPTTRQLVISSDSAGNEVQSYEGGEFYDPRQATAGIYSDGKEGVLMPSAYGLAPTTNFSYNSGGFFGDVAKFFEENGHTIGKAVATIVASALNPAIGGLVGAAFAGNNAYEAADRGDILGAVLSSLGGAVGLAGGLTSLLSADVLLDAGIQAGALTAESSAADIANYASTLKSLGINPPTSFLDDATKIIKEVGSLGKGTASNIVGSGLESLGVTNELANQIATNAVVGAGYGAGTAALGGSDIGLGAVTGAATSGTTAGIKNLINSNAILTGYNDEGNPVYYSETTGEYFVSPFELDGITNIAGNLAGTAAKGAITGAIGNNKTPATQQTVNSLAKASTQSTLPNFEPFKRFEPPEQKLYNNAPLELGINLAPYTIGQYNAYQPLNALIPKGIK